MLWYVVPTVLDAASTTSASGATGQARSSVMSSTVAPARCTRSARSAALR